MSQWGSMYFKNLVKLLHLFLDSYMAPVELICVIAWENLQLKVNSCLTLLGRISCFGLCRGPVTVFTHC